MAWLRERGVPIEDVGLLDDRTIARIIDPPRDDHGRLKIRPKPATGGAARGPWWQQVRNDARRLR